MMSTDTKKNKKKEKKKPTREIILYGMNVLHYRCCSLTGCSV
jgi:hypothetical protein